MVSCSSKSGNYGMGHKKVSVFYKTTTVQRKFCVPFPCPFRCKSFRFFFAFFGVAILGTCNGEKTGERTVPRTLSKS